MDKCWKIFARNSHKEIKIATREFKKLLLEVLKFKDWEVPDAVSEISILFCTDKTIHKLNNEYRGKDKPTDVLSFPQAKTPFSNTLGDIVISLDTAKKQALKYNCSLNQEITRLLTHGLLHLMGYDHEGVPQNEAQKMRRLEKQILTKIEQDGYIPR